MEIQVKIRFLGIFRRLSGKKSVQVKLKEPVTIRKVIFELTETFSSEFKEALFDSQLNDPRPNTLILVGGKDVSVLRGLETEVRDSQEIVLVPVIHGG